MGILSSIGKAVSSGIGGGALGIGKSLLGGAVKNTISSGHGTATPSIAMNAAPVAKSPGTISNIATDGSAAPSPVSDAPVSSSPGEAIGRRSPSKKFGGRRAISGGRR